MGEGLPVAYDVASPFYIMKCLSPIHLDRPYKRPTMLGLNYKRFPHGLDVPCGRCEACRRNKAQEWSIRLLHELKYFDKASFITLTYDDDHLPKNRSLDKNDFQLFFKRFRII